MTDDSEFARRLTEAVRETAGVTAVFPSRPIVHAAAEGVATVLELGALEVLVDVDRSEELTTITAHIAAAADLSTPQTLGAAAAAIREVAVREGVDNSMIFVKARLIADPAAPVA